MHRDRRPMWEKVYDTIMVFVTASLIVIVFGAPVVVPWFTKTFIFPSGLTDKQMDEIIWHGKVISDV